MRRDFSAILVTWGLRDYGVDGQLGLEATPEEYVARMVEVFALVREVLADDGTAWVNLGDSYAGSWGAQGHSGQMADRSVISARQIESHPQFGSRIGARGIGGAIKPKDLVGIPWRVAFALQADGWYLRQDIIWQKPNPMPESVTDRCTKSHEYLFLLSKRPRYYFDAEAIREEGMGYGRSNWNAQQFKGGDITRNHGGKGDHGKGGGTSTYEGGRNRRSVWTIATQPYAEAHFATFPEALVKPCILAGSRPGDAVLDPFAGSGTTLKVAQDLGRHWYACELNADYVKLIDDRTRQGGLVL